MYHPCTTRVVRSGRGFARLDRQWTVGRRGTVRRQHDRRPDVEALAEHLGVSARFVRRLVEERRVPYLKVGRFVRFDPIEVERWLIATRVDPLDLPASVGRRRGR